MKKTAIFAVLFLAFCAAFSLAAEIEITKKVRTSGNVTNTIYTVKGAGKYRQGFVINSFKRKDGSLSLANNAGNIAGFHQGWFGGGMMLATMKGRIRLLDKPYTFTERKDGFTIAISHEEYPSEIKYTYFPDKNYVLCTFEIKAKAPVRLPELTLLANPGHHGRTPEGKKDFARHAATAARQWKIAPDSPLEKLDPGCENYVVIWDDYNDMLGSAAVLFDPDDFVKVGVVGFVRSLVGVRFTLKDDSPRCGFLLYGIPEDHLDSDEVRAEMKKQAPALLKELKALKLK